MRDELDLAWTRHVHMHPYRHAEERLQPDLTYVECTAEKCKAWLSFCHPYQHSKCLLPASQLNADRMKHSGWCIWGVMGNADRVFQTFLLMGVWFPRLVSISQEVRRMHRLRFDKPMEPTGSREPWSSAVDPDSPGFQWIDPQGGSRVGACRNSLNIAGSHFCRINALLNVRL